jgi:tRNA pseudouridine38-40 synthase
MRNIKLTIEYDGTNYCGWQIQKVKSKMQNPKLKIRTIQSTIEGALKKILQEKVKLIASGRTDSGVHALGQVVNFKTKSKLSPLRLKAALNSNLPLDIRIKSAVETDLNFHSRFQAKSKLYRYRILNKEKSFVFKRNYSHFIPYSLDWKAMRREARVLLGSHDFSSFQTKDKRERNPVRTIKKISVFKEDGEILIDIESDGFLYNMVRNIVGTLIEVGRGKLKKGALKEILEKKNRKFAGPTAPARGLCLVKVKY